LECDDNNPLTLDQCSENICENLEVACASNIDCGVDRLFGEEFCVGNDIYKNFEEFLCKEPGELTSSCSKDESIHFVDFCEFACWEATCIFCDEDVDCNDDDSETTDTCVLPGSLESHCSNVI